MKSFAVIVPIGPGAAELRRFHDFLESLWSYERGARCAWPSTARHMCEMLMPRDKSHPRFRHIARSFSRAGGTSEGRLSASLLVGFDLIRRAGPFDFVLRADTDALIAGKFRDTVSRFLARSSANWNAGNTRASPAAANRRTMDVRKRVSDVARRAREVAA